MPPRKPTQPVPEQEPSEPTAPRQLRVTRAFRGVETKERLIPEGVYPEGDKRLLNMTYLLLERGFAEWV